MESLTSRANVLKVVCVPKFEQIPLTNSEAPELEQARSASRGDNVKRAEGHIPRRDMHFCIFLNRGQTGGSGRSWSFSNRVTQFFMFLSSRAPCGALRRATDEDKNEFSKQSVPRNVILRMFTHARRNPFLKRIHWVMR